MSPINPALLAENAVVRASPAVVIPSTLLTLTIELPGMHHD